MTQDVPPPVGDHSYEAGYTAAREAVINYPRRAIRMQLGRMAGTAKTEAQWGAVDALTDLLRDDAP